MVVVGFFFVQREKADAVHARNRAYYSTEYSQSILHIPNGGKESKTRPHIIFKRESRARGEKKKLQHKKRGYYDRLGVRG